MTLYDFIIKQLGEDSVLVVDGEMIDEADDYKMLFEDLMTITKGELVLESFSAADDEEAEIQISVSGTNHTLYLTAMGWIDENFIEKFNKVLIEKGSDKRFYTFWALDSFGQELGFFYCNEKKADEVYQYACEKNENVLDASELCQISDGSREEGYEDL